MPVRSVLRASVAVALSVAIAAPAAAEVRVSNVSVYLNDLDVTVQIGLLGAIPSTFHESLQSGVPSHVRFIVQLWQYRRVWPDRQLQTRTIERQIVYSVLTKEYKVVFLAGETREPYVTRELRDAEHVLSEVRALKLMPTTKLDPAELFYVRVRAEVALRVANTFLTRLSGEAEDTPWVQSSLLTIGRTQ